MFDHSIKVPRLYKTAAKIAKEVSEGKGSIKQLVYEGKHPNIKALYALVVHTFQKTDDIEKLFKKSKLLAKEPRFDPWLAKVLVTELLWGKKRLTSQSKPVMTILAYEQIFKAHLSDVSSNAFEEVQQVYKPRYVRINTLKTTVNEAIEEFRNEGWILKRFTGSDYLGFLEFVQKLGEEEFMVDFHIPYLLIFPPKTQFYQHQAYKKGNIILQDKASCLPGYILNPEPGSTVLDMCAAPGMKTTHCAAIIENSGKILAVEIGKKRYETLKKIIESSGATCINAINEDVLKISGNDYPDVEYILVDPSCSGSGITDRVEIGQQEMDQHKNRLEKLAGFQIKVLRHALTKFHKAKRVVYSTCSVYPEENEDVVRQVLETCFYFKLVPADKFVKHHWSNFGCAEFGDIGNYCLYARPDIDLTSGFFVAVFERLEDGETNQFLNERLFSQKMLTWRQNKGKEELEQEEVPKQEVKTENEIDDRKKKKHQDESAVENLSELEDVNDVLKDKKKRKKDFALVKVEDSEKEVISSEELALKKKKKKKTDETLSCVETPEEIFRGVETNEDTVVKKKKKKSKKKDFEPENEESLIDEAVHKKKKFDNFLSDNLVEVSGRSDLVDVNVEVKTKKKKKKSKERMLEETMCVEVEETVVESKHKKKNKKKKKCKLEDEKNA